VASATPNGSPRKMRTGNWMSPAPPPENAENALAISETPNSSSCSAASRDR